MTGHCIDQLCDFQSIYICTEILKVACKTGEQLCSIIERLMEENLIFGSDYIRVLTATAYNE